MKQSILCSAILAMVAFAPSAIAQSFSAEASFTPSAIVAADTRTDFCATWPASCVVVCEGTNSSQTSCQLRPNWLPIAPSSSAFAATGRAHNDGLAKVSALAGAQASPSSGLTINSMMALTGEALCSSTSSNAGAASSLTLAQGGVLQSTDTCVARTSGIATQTVHHLRAALAQDGAGSQIAGAYLTAFRDLNALNARQLAAMSSLYALLPDDNRLEEVPLLFARIDAFERDTKRRLSPQEAEVVLMSAAVMRASLEYWLGETEGGSNWLVMTEDGSEPVAERKKGLWRRILKLIAADAAGCLGGTVVAGVPGCVVGAVGASAAAGSNL